MIPMDRSRIFKILTEIFRDEEWEHSPYIMKEDDLVRRDINFVNPDNHHNIDYWLRIIIPADDCPEYNFVFHSAVSDKDANIAIDGAGNYRIYGDEINSFIFTTIKSNIQKFCDYAVELTELENRQAFEHVVAIINAYTNELMDTRAGEFVQRDVIPRNDYTQFVIKKAPYMWNALGVDVLRHFYKECVHSNDVWVRFNFGESCCTPIRIYPFRHEVKLDGEHLEKLTGNIITMKECVSIAKRIARELEYVVTTDSGNHFVKEAIGAINRLKEDKMIGCDEVFQVVVDWLRNIREVGNIRRDKPHQVYSVDAIKSNNISSKSLKLEVSYTPYMKTIMISLGKEHIITIDDLGLADKSTCVYIMQYEQNGIDDVLNKYLIACLAEVLKDRLDMDKLRAYTTAKCTQYTELKHCGPCFFTDDGMTAYAIDPDNVISNENINKNNKVKTILDMEAHIDSLVDKKLKKFVESGSLMYTTKDYLTDQILSQLKIDWHKDVYRSIYSSVWCTLAESRFKTAAYEFEKHFMEYVTLENFDYFTVIFGLQRIDDNLPGIEIKFYNATQEVCVRMLDHKSSGSGTWSYPLIELKSGTGSKVYFDTIKKTNCTYKSFLANVVSKIVLLEGLS